MTDTPATATTKSSDGKRFIVPVLLAITVIAGLGYFASKAGLDKAAIKQVLDAWITQQESRAKASGVTLDIAYSDIVVSGGLTDKQIEILEPRATISDDAVANSTSIVTTERVVLHPESLDLSKFRAEIPTPLELRALLEEKERMELRVSANTPLMFDITRSGKDEEASIAVKHFLPNAWKIESLPESEVSNATPTYDIVRITLDEGGQYKGTIFEQKKAVGSGMVSASNLQFFEGEETEPALKLASISGQWNSQLDTKNHARMSSQLKLDTLEFLKDFQELNPISLSWDFSFEGASQQPLSAEGSAPETEAPASDASFKLADFNFSIRDAKLSANADFVASAEDILPVGMANISIVKLSELRDAFYALGIMDASHERLVDKMLLTITGKGINESDDVMIDIKRVRGGSFQIGKTTFEEVMTVFLTEIMQGGKSIPMQAPPAVSE